jgi:hypothetical protein
MTDFATALTAVLSVSGMGQKDLAAALGVKSSFLNDVLHSRRKPGVKLCDAVARFERERQWPAPPEGFERHWHTLGARADGWNVA